MDYYVLEGLTINQFTGMPVKSRIKTPDTSKIQDTLWTCHSPNTQTATSTSNLPVMDWLSSHVSKWKAAAVESRSRSAALAAHRASDKRRPGLGS